MPKGNRVHTLLEKSCLLKFYIKNISVEKNSESRLLCKDLSKCVLELWSRYLMHIVRFVNNAMSDETVKVKVKLVHLLTPSPSKFIGASIPKNLDRFC